MLQSSYVLDTGILLLVVREGPTGALLRERYGLDTVGARALISVVSHGELRALARRRRWGDKKLQAVEHVLDNCVTIEISHPVIDAYVDLDEASQAARGGARSIGKNDLWIAATARASGSALITTDKDFDHLHPEWIVRELIVPRA